MNRLRHLFRASRSDHPVVELDRWQLTGVLLLVLALTMGSFFIGRAMAPRATASDSAEPLARALPRAVSTVDRQIALAEVWPPTETIDKGLARPVDAPLPSDPTARARALAHQQLQGARSAGLRNDLPAPAPESPTMLVADPVAPTGAGGYTLQVSVFDSATAAQVISDELASKGHAVRLRPVRSADGRNLVRVEVGNFSSAEAATVFQRRFEMDSGYSAVLIPL
jgi:cell division septation protein DedD